MVSVVGMNRLRGSLKYHSSHSQECIVHRIGFVLKVRQEHIEEYKQRHAAVWPEMLDALRECGWHNYSLFLSESGLLFGYFETPDNLATANACMADKEINTRWQESMAPFFASLDNARPDLMLLELEEVFHLD